MKVFGEEITKEQLNLYFEEKEILYKDYKSKDIVFLTRSYNFFTKKPNSYNAEKKTIVVYVPRQNVVDLANKILDETKKRIEKSCDNKEYIREEYLRFCENFTTEKFMMLLVGKLEYAGIFFNIHTIELAKEFRAFYEKTKK